MGDSLCIATLTCCSLYRLPESFASVCFTDNATAERRGNTKIQKIQLCDVMTRVCAGAVTFDPTAPVAGSILVYTQEQMQIPRCA